MSEEKKQNPVLRVLALFVTFALVLGAVFLVANWQKLNFDAVKRYFAYRALAKNETGQAESFPYDGGTNSAFARLGEDFFVCSRTGVRLYSPSGTVYFEQTAPLEHPVAQASGNVGLAYDVGGSSLFVCADRSLAFSLTGGDIILSASLSAQGRLTVVTQASGLKGSVTVYDANYQPALQVNLSSRFVTDAVLSPNGRTLALATTGLTGGIYDSQIAFYSTDRTLDNSAPDAVCSLGSVTALKLNWGSEPLRVLGESALYLVNTDGSLAGEYSYAGRYLKGYSLDGDNCSALLLGKHRAGSSAQLILVDSTGQEHAALSLDRQLLSLSAAGHYFSVLTADTLTIYTQDLEVYHTLSEPQGARKVLQTPDGSAVLIGSETAQLYLPN